MRPHPAGVPHLRPRRRLEALLQGDQALTMDHDALLVAQPLTKSHERQYDRDEGGHGQVSHDLRTSVLDTRRGGGQVAVPPSHCNFRGASAVQRPVVADEGSPDAEVRRLLEGGQRALAFELLVSRYQGKVFRLAMSYVRSAADAEDLAQEAFVRLWRALPLYDGRASLSTWFYVIARNACLSELRRRRARPTLPLDETAEPRRTEGLAPAPASDLRLDCARLLETLPETQRQVVRLFYLEDRSYDEVAALLAMPKNTVRSHLHRARRRLALSLGARE